MRTRSFIEARVLEQSGAGTQSRYLAIDVSGLPADRYDLTVSVLDLTSGAAARESARFERLAAWP